VRLKLTEAVRRPGLAEAEVAVTRRLVDEFRKLPPHKRRGTHDG